MDIKDIHLFLSIAEEKNLTRAASKNGYTQSAASHILKNLEAELGFPLFSRSQKGVVLTKDGEALLPHVRRILSATECFEQKASAISGIQAGHITVGALSDAFQWLPAALEAFYTEYPNIIVEIREGSSQKIQTWLENGIVDFAICCSDLNKKMDWIPLLKEPYLAVCSLHSSCVGEAAFDLKRLTDFPYIQEEDDEDLPRQLQKLNIDIPMPKFSSMNICSMLSMARHNLGICILPEPALRNNVQNVVILPLIPPLERNLGIRLPSLSKASPAARLLISQLQKTIYESERPVE